MGNPMTESLPRRPRVLGSPRSVALAKEGVPPEWEPGCGTPRRRRPVGRERQPGATGHVMSGRRHRTRREGPPGRAGRRPRPPERQSSRAAGAERPGRPDFRFLAHAAGRTRTQCGPGAGPDEGRGARPARPPGSPASGVATPPRARRRDPRCPPPRPARPSSRGGVAHATVTLTGTNPRPPCAETCAASSPDGSATSARPTRAGINPGDSARGGLAHTRRNSSHGLRTGTAAGMWSTSYRPDRFAGVSQVVRG